MKRMMRGYLTMLSLLLFGCSLAFAEVTKQEGPVFDIPRLDGITIDGKIDDWGVRGFCINVMTDADGHPRSLQDFAARAWLGWNDQGVLVLIHVTDDRACEAENESGLYTADSIELFMATQLGTPDFYQVIASPGVDPKYPQPRFHLYDQRKDTALHATPLDFHCATLKTPGGYWMEALLPWKNLAVKPAIGKEIALQLQVNDLDPGTERAQFLWYPQTGAFGDSTKMQRVRLASTPSEPVHAVAYVDTEHLSYVQFTVYGINELVGKSVQLMQGPHAVLEDKLADDGQDGAVVTLALPLTMLEKAKKPLSLHVAGQQIPIDIPDAAALRNAYVNRVNFRFSQYVFAGATFPQVGVENPSDLECAIGHYRIATTFYDANFNRVLTADTPGRYGAIVEAISASGIHIKRFYTLFRQAGPIDWRTLRLSTCLELPDGLGVNAEVKKNQASQLADFSKHSLQDSLTYVPETAVMLAGLYETQPTEPAAGQRTNVWSRDDHWWCELKKRTGNLEMYKYITYLPDGYEKDTQAKWPLILVLHGSGERSTPAERFKSYYTKYDMVNIAKTQYPCVLVTPQCPEGEWWKPDMLIYVLDEVMQKYRIDPSRVYMTGFSMGGYGTFSTAIAYPERFAAIAPICGGGDPSDAARLKNMPVWVFHGTADPTVPITQSEEMVVALTALGGEVKFTKYPGVGHDAWTQTFNNPELYAWFLQHRLQTIAK
ncbi:MAG TPA: sugar-binding protein [Armatimonadota bacterium]|nr:sugar-binding protein [Armatimonadota bacterium]